MSDGENGRSLAGLWNRARWLLAGSLHQDGDGWGAGGGAVHPSKALGAFLQAMAGSTAPVIVDLGPAIGANVSFLGSRLGCKLFPEDLYAHFDMDVLGGKSPVMVTSRGLSWRTCTQACPRPMRA